MTIGEWYKKRYEEAARIREEIRRLDEEYRKRRRKLEKKLELAEYVGD